MREEGNIVDGDYNDSIPFNPQNSTCERNDVIFFREALIWSFACFAMPHDCTYRYLGEWRRLQHVLRDCCEECFASYRSTGYVSSRSQPRNNAGLVKPVGCRQRRRAQLNAISVHDVLISSYVPLRCLRATNRRSHRHDDGGCVPAFRVQSPAHGTKSARCCRGLCSVVNTLATIS